MTRTRETIFIIAFTFAAFVLGTTEYVIVGLLKDISVSLSISLAAAGVLVSSFAIAYAIGTPFAVTLLGRIPRHVTILTAYIAVLLFNYLTIFATTYPVMLFIRIITAILCGLTLSLAIAATSEHMKRFPQSRCGCLDHRRFLDCQCPWRSCRNANRPDGRMANGFHCYIIGRDHPASFDDGCHAQEQYH